MASATLEDFNGTIELVFFSDCYEQHQQLVCHDAIVALEGKVDTSRNRLQFVVENVLKSVAAPMSSKSRRRSR